jgi:organic hydroperoxide reductase OsmC/OhrA
MAENSDGSGQFTAVVLRPTVTITSASDREKARSLHHDAAKLCFIARSMNFPVGHEPTIIVHE